MAKPESVDRKYKIALLSLALCTVCFIGTGFFEGLQENYGTFVMAVGMVLGLYGGANVGNKWVLAKHGVLRGPKGEVLEEQSEHVEVEVKPEESGKP